MGKNWLIFLLGLSFRLVSNLAIRFADFESERRRSKTCMLIDDGLLGYRTLVCWLTFIFPFDQTRKGLGVVIVSRVRSASVVLDRTMLSEIKSSCATSETLGHDQQIYRCYTCYFDRNEVDSSSKDVWNSDVCPGLRTGKTVGAKCLCTRALVLQSC